jgi:MurNAc alpha-1-phosphate uridylyltransferase
LCTGCEELDQRTPAKKMKAMIFSAGLGTRFKPWTDKHPKALGLVNGKSLLQRNVEYLAKYGVKEIIVNVHHFADQVENVVRENNGWGCNIIISDERDILLDTGGGLLHAKKYFTPGESFITCNVDILTDLDIDRLYAFHKRSKALASFGVTDRETSRYLLFDEYNQLSGWRNVKTGEEKLPRPCPDLYQKAYSCVVIFDYAIFDMMESHSFKGKFSLIDVYLALANKTVIMGYDHTGDRFVDVGKPESVTIAEKLFP